MAVRADIDIDMRRRVSALAKVNSRGDAFWRGASRPNNRIFTEDKDRVWSALIISNANAE